jgi:cytoskeleton protein RodZ
MTDSADDAAPARRDDGAVATAGAMLRAAREERGLHIAALAAAIKVPQRKLEALESDRYEQLLDLTFTRALAQTVCRSLKIDAQPVLDRLPQVPGTTPKLQHVSEGLATPFREGGASDESGDWSWLRRPVIWAALLVLLGAAAVYWLPERFFERWRGAASAAAPVAVATPGPTAPAAAAPPATTAPAAATASLGQPEPIEAPASSTAVAALKPVGTALLGVKLTGESWVEVQDARGQTLLSRKVAAGESLGLDGEVPLRVTIGNASAAQLTFRGRLVDLNANTVANVARLQLD